MVHSLREFLEHWEVESTFTRQLLEALTDSSLACSPGGPHRSVGRVAWHITGSIGEMMGRTGLAVGGPSPEAPVPARATEIARTYAEASRSLAAELRRRWTDADLAVEDDMYGERWARGRTLLVLLLHEVHHRGQLTVLMRLAGLRVPQTYGPAYEDWSAFGQQPPAV